MPLETWIAFVVATEIVLLIPGPTILLVVAYALGQGRRAALHTVSGVALGDLTSISLALAGLGALLAASASLFTLLKIVGAAYLVYLGVRLWRARPESPAGDPATSRKSGRAMLWHAYAVTATNPKSIAFFIAFLPQFMSPSAPPVPQAAIIAATFVGLATLNAAAYAMAAGGARRFLGTPRAIRIFNRLGGTALIGAGIVTVALRQAR
ncbi:LysE family translocator [Oceanibacterium hippocampi]|uniref:Homoserine/homoserine lactone efflux protein n=1 Tax=Oceanibacterium hippocampi TaxID=745714 RepID=A0A1Y5RA22_9PROT|nr:LysE family translocator [Oceanibacterium hippocampi]SLN12610.1 Homoserine/homoserine lactone efflux protein [Oceanibacterium hippocampi]